MERGGLAVFERMAALFAYPDASYPGAVRDAVHWAPTDAAPALSSLAEAIADRTVSQIEELYIATFDMNPDAALEIGWHLFGEDYARGEFLVKLREENRRYGVEENGELPDNLAVVLRLLARLPEGEAEVFAKQYIAPALRKMRGGIKRKDNPYLHLLDALLHCMDSQEPASATFTELPVLKETYHG